MQQAKKGLTLIETMSVVGVIGILVTIAVMQYGNYISRTRAVDTVAELAPYKLAIGACYQNSGALANCNVGAFGVPAPLTSTNVKTLTLGNGILAGTSSATTSSGVAMDFTYAPSPAVETPSLTWGMTGTICDNSRGIRPGDGLCS